MGSQRRVALKMDLDWLHKRHTGIFSGAQQYAKEQGWTTIIDEFVEWSPRYDGVIGRATMELAEWSRKHSAPVINVWLNSPAMKILPGVFPDCQASGRLRAEHLLDRGFHRFASLTEREPAARQEAAEYQRVIREAGYSCVDAAVSVGISMNYSAWQKIESTITTWMDSWELPIGIYVRSDFIGRIVVQKCLERGWRVPEDVGIVAGMNEEAICEHSQPSLSSVECGFERIGYQAAKLLDELMDRQGSVDDEPQHLYIPPQGLVVRESSDFYSVDDPLVASALEFISANSHRNIGQDDVAAAVSVGSRTLQSRFRKILDRPIAAVIRQVRIDRAKRELTMGNCPLAIIARNAGFSSPERLNEVFRRELGVSPSEYRKQLSGGS